jgi:ABC-type uncharacterized transport system ATPase subunit
MAEALAPAVALKGVTKRFPGVVANDAITLEFHPGEVHALLGENGAGKSTLIGLLAGMQQPDAGSIELFGEAARIASPRDALDRGIGTVFQHVLLVPSLTVIENLMLGGRWWRRLGREAALARFRALSEMLGVHIDPDAPVGRLELGQQQQVEIIRALWRDAKVLILDEPTSMLTPQGVEDLGRVMRRLAQGGVAVIFITHKLREAYAFGDRISVLRLGKLVGQLPPERLRAMSEAAATNEVIRLMFGQLRGHSEEAETLVGRARHGPTRAVDRSGTPRLELLEVSTDAVAGECALNGLSLSLWPGEVLGIAGVDGNGQKHLAEVLAGQRPVASGRILIDGEDVTHEGVAARRRRGLSYITDERLGEGTVGVMSVATNLVLKEVGRPPLWRNGLTLWDRIHGHAREQVARHDIRTPSERTPVGRLSGGNIQKVVLARELGEAARIAVFNKPTYGLDLQNTRLARQRIRESAERGMATLVISTELDELLEVSDRIGVMFQGRLAGVIENAGEIEESVGRMMTGAAA